MRKHICQSCGQEFTRFWNLKRHLLTIHPTEYAHWNIKSDLIPPHSSRSNYNVLQSNDMYFQHPRNFEESILKNIESLIIKKMEESVLFDPDRMWKINMLNELQMIKIEVQVIKSILLSRRN